MRRTVFALVLALIWSVVLAAEPGSTNLDKSQFVEFLSRFPTLTWDKLDSLRMVKESDLINSDTISIMVANHNIWDRNTPWVKLTQGRYRRYMNAYMGIFYTTEGVKYDEETEEWIPSGEHNKVYPLAKINLYDDVVMLVVGYKYFSEISFEFSQEVYLFKKSTQQLTSSFCLSGDNPAHTILYENQLISSYELEERMDEDVVYHYVYKIGSDGFLEEVENYGIVELYAGSISDKDGFVNVRQSPSTNAKILYTIPNAAKIVYFLPPKSKWAEIHSVYDTNGHAINKMGGFVHVSRINKAKKF